MVNEKMRHSPARGRPTRGLKRSLPNPSSIMSALRVEPINPRPKNIGGCTNQALFSTCIFLMPIPRPIMASARLKEAARGYSRLLILPRRSGPSNGVVGNCQRGIEHQGSYKGGDDNAENGQDGGREARSISRK